MSKKPSAWRVFNILTMYDASPTQTLQLLEFKSLSCDCPQEGPGFVKMRQGEHNSYSPLLTHPSRGLDISRITIRGRAE